MSYYLWPQSLQLMSPAEARDSLGLPPHNLTFSTTVTMETRPRPPTELVEALVEVLQRCALVPVSGSAVRWCISPQIAARPVCV